MSITIQETMLSSFDKYVSSRRDREMIFNLKWWTECVISLFIQLGGRSGNKVARNDEHKKLHVLFSIFILKKYDKF